MRKGAKSCGNNHEKMDVSARVERDERINDAIQSCSKKSPRDPGRICKNMNIDCESRDSKNTIKQLRCKVLFKLVCKQHHLQNPRSEANSPLRNAHLFAFPFCKTIKIFSFELLGELFLVFHLWKTRNT